MTATMHQVCCEQFAPPEQLRVIETPVPEPRDGEVQVKITAAGVGFVDGLMVQGLYQVKPPLPYYPGSEFAGVVSAIGAGVTGTMAVRAQAVGLAEMISGGVLALLPLLSCLSDQSRGVSKHSAPTAMRCWQVFQKSNGQSLNSHFREWRQCAPA